jgi:hypothetical protein
MPASGALTRRIVSMFVVAAGLIAAGFAQAESLPRPAEAPILTVSGKIDVVNGRGVAQFDRAMLESVGMVSIVTSTPWYDEPVKFEGVPLAKLMDAVGAHGERILAVALNDYSAELPIEDFKKYNVILALKSNGQYMPVRDKGPLFIIYPFDSQPELKAQKFYSRCVWQVARLEVK